MHCGGFDVFLFSIILPKNRKKYILKWLNTYCNHIKIQFKVFVYHVKTLFPLRYYVSLRRPKIFDKITQFIWTLLKGQLNSGWIYEVIISLKIPTKKTEISALPWPHKFILTLTDKLNVKSTEIFWQIVVAFSVYMNSNIQKNDVPNNFVGTFVLNLR